MNNVDQVCQGSGKISDTGRPVNEDELLQFIVPDAKQEIRYTILMDGATGLGKNKEIVPGFTSAEWYVDYMVGNLYDQFINSPICDIKEAIEKCVNDVIHMITNYENESGIKLAEYEKPSSALIVKRETNDDIELFVLGDAEVLIEYRSGNIEQISNPNRINLQNNDKQVLDCMKKLATSNGFDIIDARNTPEIEEMLEINREKKNRNCNGGYWVLGTTSGVTNYGVYLKLNRANVASILLTTDGFNRQMLNKSEKEMVNLVKSIGVIETLKMIRNAENNDLSCNIHPRFKVHDDATASLTIYEETV